MEPSSLSVKSTTKVTVEVREPSAEPREDASPVPDVQEEKEETEFVVSEAALKAQLRKELESYAVQLHRLKATVDNFNALVDEKEKATANIKVSIQLLSDSLAPLDKQIEHARKEADSKRCCELAVLEKNIRTAGDQAGDFRKLVADFTAEVEAKKSSLTARRERAENELEQNRRRFQLQTADSTASLKEVRQLHQQVLAEKNKQVEERKEQLEKVSFLGKECQKLYDQFQNVGAEKKSLGRKLQELEHNLKEVEELSRKEKESPVLIKIADNRKNVALREKQHVGLCNQRDQKKKLLETLAAKQAALAQDLTSLRDERTSLEKTFQHKMDELDRVSAECVEKADAVQKTKMMTEDFERQMKEKIDEARRASESYSQELLREMEGVRRASVSFASQAERRKRKKEEEQEKAKEELRQEVQAAGQMLDTLRQGHQLEMATTQRYYARVEKELEIFGSGEKEGLEFEIQLVQENAQKLGVQASRELSQFEQTLKEQQLEIEREKLNLAVAKKIAAAQRTMQADGEKATRVRESVRTLDKQLRQKREQHHLLLKQEFDLRKQLEKAGVAVPKEPQEQNQQVLRTSHAQMQTRAAPLQLDGPISKARVASDSATVEQVKVEGASGRYTVQTLSKPSDCRVETEQMETVAPSDNPDVELTTRLKKCTYSGKGVDKNVLNQASSVLRLEKEGFTPVETHSERELRADLLRRAAELQKQVQNLEFLHGLNTNKDQELQRRQSRLERDVEQSQRSFADLSHGVSHVYVSADMSQSLNQVERNLQEDRAAISRLRRPSSHLPRPSTRHD